MAWDRQRTTQGAGKTGSRQRVLPPTLGARRDGADGGVSSSEWKPRDCQTLVIAIAVGIVTERIRATTGESATTPTAIYQGD